MVCMLVNVSVCVCVCSLMCLCVLCNILCGGVWCMCCDGFVVVCVLFNACVLRVMSCVKLLLLFVCCA